MAQLSSIWPICLLGCSASRRSRSCSCSATFQLRIGIAEVHQRLRRTAICGLPVLHARIIGRPPAAADLMEDNINTDINMANSSQVPVPPNQTNASWLTFHPDMEEDNRKRARLRKSIQLFLSRKLKIPPIHIPSSTIPAKITSNRLLSTCRFPRTPSLHGGGDHNTTTDDDSNSRDHAATLSDVDRFLFDNFRSLYINDGDNGRRPSSSPGAFTPYVDTTQPAAAAETSSTMSESVAEDVRETSPGDENGSSTAIMLFSMDPYKDFRGSMQNIIEMHHGEEPLPLDWDFLEELLFYYLQLNDQSVHKYILKAFADLTAGAHVSCPARGKSQWTDKNVRSRKDY
uniref:Transcription repressor n=1 Tax=Leersia perrieri TaxID=77586 RepID=A0A0D9V2H1_9ORYZ